MHTGAFSNVETFVDKFRLLLIIIDADLVLSHFCKVFVKMLVIFLPVEESLQVTTLVI